MQCPKCGAIAPTEDIFCEECGTALAVLPTRSSNGCAKCGAGSEQIDPQGFCSICGFRNQSGRNHLEIAVQPNLGGVSDRGLRHHRNEDYLALQQVKERAYVLVVCDGVSSSSEPDLASKAAADSACVALTDAIRQGVKLEEAMNTAFALALASVCAVPYSTGVDEEPPSTTIVAAVVENRTATIGWMGDSRAYWLSSSGSLQLTKDDSWLNEVVASGRMTEAVASHSPQAHAITAWLGLDAGDSAKPSIVNFNIPGSGYLLLCTDGLWNYVSDPVEIAELIQQMSDKEAVSISRSFVEFARLSGGHDNITAAILSL